MKRRKVLSGMERVRPSVSNRLKHEDNDAAKRNSGGVSKQVLVFEYVSQAVRFDDVFNTQLR